jgi:hypothetical protein
MFHDRQKFQMREAHVDRIGNQSIAKLIPIQIAITFFQHAQP